ncbi:MAG: hypothetical protein KIC77_06760 [Clostridiales bacterium]|nr:hypothetical protein [Clostridiales bacterium]
MGNNICIIFGEQYSYELLDTLISNNSFDKIYCIFLTEKSFVDRNFYGNIIALSQDNFNIYQESIDIVYVCETISKTDNRIIELIKLATKQGKKIIFAGSSQNTFTNTLEQYFKSNILLTQRTNISAVSILILNMCNNTGALPLELKLYDALKEEYKLSVISSNQAAALFGFTTYNYNPLLYANINSVFMRDYLNQFVKDIVNFNNAELLIYDFPYSIASPDIITSEAEDILFENLINAVSPDYIIYLLPVNRTDTDYIDKISEYFMHQYMLQINNFVIYDRVFDEVQYSNSHMISTFKCSENTKLKISKKILGSYKIPTFCLWDKLVQHSIIDYMEDYLGNGLQYQVL